jgi:hypothetical protein
MNTKWQFDDAPNSASFTTSFVLEGSPILRVYHDYEGGWQFHGSPDQPATAELARVVSLASIVALDSTLVQLRDLPFGWRAARANVRSPWQREKNNPFPTYAENGFYLEDAVWISQYLPDVSPPPEDVRNEVPPDTYVKLLFRFAAEDAERADGETERMWVQVIERDEDGFYVGALANDPHHAHVLTCGDTICFHPVHIMEVLAAEN